ncbi:MAG: hypothetical protein A2934_01870 [Candidatus Sungbacteria bacterium RIFCSPLOWO2_01_FULL_47_10]|uniref:ATP synthase F1 subunit gamma n=1 Tax=Candidatus Sungbacteria bacterium RIFCSPLOWO2_01_FULL_47_10 TaxID=1802276 RepID=A0A1G2L1K3_9BACT|nr:MAG: hypothetical protein A2934_01870 [Candidatus Sungbacteria bacterium RIFCSPLOWO2_01_FULL_47_10]
MINNKTIKEELERLDSLKALVETYKSIAASTMRRIRNSVLENRAFHLGLARIYQEVRIAYQKELVRILRRKGRKDVEAMNVLKKNGKTVFVFLSANVGLYGDIIRKTFHFFAEQVNRYHPEVIVVGRIGRVLFEETFPGVSYSYFDFPDTHIDLDSIRKISRTIHEYEDVFIFHGRFKNVVEQLPVSSNISGQELGGGAPHDAGARYIFEPTLEDVAIFFETEIFASTLEQSFNESRLAKLASRMMLLDRSTTHIDTEAHKMYFEKQRLRHRTYNKKQLDAVSGVALWGSS